MDWIGFGIGCFICKLKTLLKYNLSWTILMYAKLLYSNRTKNFVMLSIYFKNHMIYIMFSTISTLTLKFWKNCLDFKRDKKSLANKHLFLFCCILFSRSDSSFSFFVFFFNFFFQAICCIVMLIGISDFTV